MLKISSLKTDKKLITKCRIKKEIKKKPDKAINTFLPTEDFENPLLIIYSVYLIIKRYTNVEIVVNEAMIYGRFFILKRGG